MQILRLPGNPVHGGFPARSKLHRAQTGARLRVAPGTYVPAVAIQATEIPPIQPLVRGFPEVSSCDAKSPSGTWRARLRRAVLKSRIWPSKASKRLRRSVPSQD